MGKVRISFQTGYRTDQFSYFCITSPQIIKMAFIIRLNVSDFMMFSSLLFYRAITVQEEFRLHDIWTDGQTG